MRPHYLRCAYLQNPLAVHDLQPRLSWELQADGRNRRQSAFQIRVASSLQKLFAGDADLWDSGRVDGNATNQIRYDGKKLPSRAFAYWQVRIWDETKTMSQWSEPACWRMGNLHSEDWIANWIGAEPKPPIRRQTYLTDPGDCSARGNPQIPPSPLLRREFQIQKPVSRALCTATALGVYELHLNGKKVGDRLLAPEWTDYQKCVQVQTYDITADLLEGDNCLGAILGDGWYLGILGYSHLPLPERGKHNHASERQFLLQMEIEYADGTAEQVISDAAWQVCRDSMVQSADIYLGATVDARKDLPGWDLPGFDTQNWERAHIFTDPGIQRVPQRNEPIRILQQLKPINCSQTKNGAWLFDFGQNMVGFCSMRIDESEGSIVKLEHGEILDPQGELYRENLRNAEQTDYFIADGRGARWFQPFFTYHGFRYVRVSGLSRTPGLDDLLGLVTASDCPVAGDFACSHRDLNQLWSNICWTQRGNIPGVPTDCPQRDERLGWTGDALIFSQTGMSILDMAAFFSKWMQDLRDTQQPDGKIGDFAPYCSPSPDCWNSPGWADAALHIPWRVYLNYGDRQILEDQFAAMQKYIDNILQHNPNLIWTQVSGNNYGDWLNTSTLMTDDPALAKAKVPDTVFSTAYLAYCTRLLAGIAAVLGKAELAEHYAKFADAVRQVFQQEFVSPEGRVFGNTQAGLAMALQFDLLPESLRPLSAEHLANAIVAAGNRLTTGFHATIMAMQQLCRTGYCDLAYRLIESRRFPSWIYSIDQGATTIWERWDGYVEGRGFQSNIMNSFSHYAFGSIGEWMMQHIIGIQLDPQSPGFRRFTIQAEPGSSLTWAKGSYRSINGPIRSEWHIKDQEWHQKITVPVNAEAQVVIPAAEGATVREGSQPADRAAGVRLLHRDDRSATFLVASGEYEFHAPMPTGSAIPRVATPEFLPADTIAFTGDETQVRISCATPEAQIRYTLDHSSPNSASSLYQEPIVLSDSAALNARAFRAGWLPSLMVSAEYRFVPAEKTSRVRLTAADMIVHRAFRAQVELINPPNPPYNIGGIAALVDGLQGCINPSVNWLGFPEHDFIATLHFSESLAVDRISIRFLQNIGYNMWLPKAVTLQIAVADHSFQTVARIETDEQSREFYNLIREYAAEDLKATTMAVRIIAENIGFNPPIHPTGDPRAWLMVDEIIVE